MTHVLLLQRPYLDSQAQRLLSEVTATAAVDVAEQKKRQDIETQARDTTTRQSVAKARAEATLAENEQKRREAESHMQLTTAKAAYDRDEQRALVEATLMAKRKEIELATENARLRRDQEEATRRAADLAAATVDAESAVRKAQGEASFAVELAKGEANKMQELATGEAAARITRAKAEAAEVEIRAAAKLVADLKEAEGTRAKLEAEAAGSAKLYEATLINPQFASLQRTLDSSQPVEIARASADAVRDMRPQLSFFTSGGPDAANDPLAPLRKVGPGALSMLRAYAQQLGITVPGAGDDPSKQPPPSTTN